MAIAFPVLLWDSLRSQGYRGREHGCLDIGNTFQENLNMDKEEMVQATFSTPSAFGEESPKCET